MRHRWQAIATAILVTTCAAGRAEAQNWGVKGGVALGDVKWGSEVVIDTKQAISPVGGAFWRWKPATWLDLQFEGLVAQQVIDFSEEGAEIKDTVTYAEVPFLIKYTIVSGETLKVRAHGGGAADFTLLAREDVNGETVDIRESLTPFTASLVIGVEVDWHRWTFDARYLFGMTDIYDLPEPTAKSRSFQFTAGFRF